MTVQINHQTGIITVPDIGVTLRTLLSVAGKAYPTTRRRTWRIMYKNVVIGSVRVKTTTTSQEITK